MNSERIKEIQGKTAYPDSVSVQQALFQVWNECQQDFKKTLAELERVKTTRDQYFKAAIHAQDKLTQAEKELGKLRDFVQEFYNLKNPSNRQRFQITEKAYQLLTPKE